MGDVVWITGLPTRDGSYYCKLLSGKSSRIRFRGGEWENLDYFLDIHGEYQTDVVFGYDAASWFPVATLATPIKITEEERRLLFGDEERVTLVSQRDRGRKNPVGYGPLSALDRIKKILKLTKDI